MITGGSVYEGAIREGIERELGIRLSNLSPGTPVLYTSGYTDSEIARRGLLDPGTHFLQKPFSPDVVIRRVAELLRSRDR